MHNDSARDNIINILNFSPKTKEIIFFRDSRNSYNSRNNRYYYNYFNFLRHLEYEIRYFLEKSNKFTSKQIDDCRGYLSKSALLKNFTIELSDEEVYIKHGKYKLSEILTIGKGLENKYSDNKKWHDIIEKILKALEDELYKVPNSNQKNLDYDSTYDDIIKRFEQNLEGNNESKEFDNNRERNNSRDRKDNDIEQNSEFDSMEPPIYNIDSSILDNLPFDIPSDIGDWIDKVKNIESYSTLLGCFVPGSTPIKIIMYSKTIQRVANKRKLSKMHLFEATLSHELFHALHFFTYILEKLKDLRHSQNSNILNMLTPNLTGKEMAQAFWSYFKHDAINHWYAKNVKTYSNQVLEPLAVAFEISWIKDRLITQKNDHDKWLKIMEYELKRFSGLASYPSDPYCGAKYLVTDKNNRNKLANMKTINKNISQVMSISNNNMKQAYDYIINNLK